MKSIKSLFNRLVDVFMPTKMFATKQEVRKHVVLFLLFSFAVFSLCALFAPFQFFDPKNPQTAALVGLIGVLAGLTVVIYKYSGHFKLDPN